MNTVSDIERLINEYVVGFRAERNRDIIRDKLIVGLSIKEIADKHGLSPTRIKTVIRTFKRKLDALEK